MAEDTMSAEQAPQQQGEVQHTTQFDRQPMKLAAEGAFSGQNPSFSTENNIKSNQLDARLGGGATAGRQPTREPGFPVPPVPPMPESSQGTGGKRFGGIKGKVATGLAVLGLMGAGGAVYGVTQSGGEDGNSDKGITLNVDPTKVRPTATPPETPIPTEIPLSERLPYKIVNEVTVGNVAVGITEGVTKPVSCDIRPGVTVTCPGLSEVYLDTNVDPEGARIKSFDETVKYMAWKDRNPDDPITKEEFVAKLKDPNSELTIHVEGFEGASAFKQDLTIDLKEKFHYEQLPFSFGGLYKTDENWRGSIREVKGEVYLEMADSLQGALAPELQLNNDFPPEKFNTSMNMVRIASIFIDHEYQKNPSYVGAQFQRVVANIETLKKTMLVDGIEGPIKAKPSH